MKLKLQNFNIAYGNKGNGLTVDHNDEFFNLDSSTMINVIAGNCFEDWDDEDHEDFEIINDLVESFVLNNHEENQISMWFD